ncbi:MAG: peptidoglycan DD-metalloendopeptidase family protein [Thermales bacterium]|nr:peptidoglycan DD-metalloendopeptidase family protein [Thermales bacterium]
MYSVCSCGSTTSIGGNLSQKISVIEDLIQQGKLTLAAKDYNLEALKAGKVNEKTIDTVISIASSDKFDNVNLISWYRDTAFSGIPNEDFHDNNQNNRAFDIGAVTKSGVEYSHLSVHNNSGPQAGVNAWIEMAELLKSTGNVTQIITDNPFVGPLRSKSGFTAASNQGTTSNIRIATAPGHENHFHVDIDVPDSTSSNTGNNKQLSIGEFYRTLIDIRVEAQSAPTSKTGSVSFYGRGDGFDSSDKTANGDQFDPNGLTAASPYKSQSDTSPLYPFGTKLKVTNPTNNKSVVVTVNDTGNFGTDEEFGGRILDLAYGAFIKIAPESQGVIANAKVEITDGVTTTSSEVDACPSDSSSSSSSQFTDSDSVFPVDYTYQGPGTQQDFGPRRGGNHAGLDLTPTLDIYDSIANKANIYAYRSGKVQNAGGSMNEVDIVHKDGTSARYLHNSKLLVKIGDEVNAGQPIAILGTTGASAQHLHIEIYSKSGSLVDPATVLFGSDNNPNPSLKKIGSPKSVGAGLN